MLSILAPHPEFNIESLSVIALHECVVSIGWLARTSHSNWNYVGGDFSKIASVFQGQSLAALV